MARRKWRDERFSERLVAIRKSRGLTQVQLAKLTGITQRAISYYETQNTYPPAPIVVQLSQALRVSTDELLGVKALKVSEGKSEKKSPALQRLWARFQMVLGLPERDQRAVMRLVSSLTRSKALERRVRNRSGKSAVVAGSSTRALQQ